MRIAQKQILQTLQTLVVAEKQELFMLPLFYLILQEILNGLIWILQQVPGIVALKKVAPADQFHC